MKLRFLFLILFLFFSWWARVYAQEGDDSPVAPVILTDEQDSYPLGFHLEILEDPSGELTIEDVTSPAYAEQFSPSQVDIPNYGFSDSAYWVRLRLSNNSQEADQWFLGVGFNNMHFVDLYSPTVDGGGFEIKQTGGMRPPSVREIHHPNLVFRLTPPKQSEQTYFLRFENGAPMVLPLTLWQPDAFYADALRNMVFLAAFLGIMIGLFGYNLFLFISLRDFNYLYLALLLLAAVIYETSQTSFLEFYLISDLYRLKQDLIALSSAVILVSLILFYNSFLSAKTVVPNLYRFTLILLGFSILLGLSTFITSYHNIAVVMSPTIVVVMVTVMISVVIAWRRGFRAARFLVIAMFGLLAGLLLFILGRMSLIPISTTTESAFRLGLIWMAICSSLALSDRVNLLQAETAGARNKLAQILEGMPLGVVVYEKDFKPTFTNQRVTEILGNPDQGIEPDISAGRTLPEALQYFGFRTAGTDERYPLEKFPAFHALQGQPDSADDLEVDLVDRRFPVEVWASPVLDEAGNVESAVVVFQDVSERKKKDAELEQYREHLEQMVERQTAELSATNEWLSTLKRVGQTVGGTVDLPLVYDELLASILQLFDARLAFLVRLNNQGKQFEVECLRGQEDDSITDSEKLALIVGICPPLRQELLAGNPVHLSADQSESIPAAIRDVIQEHDLQSILLKPVMGGESVGAVFGIIMRQPMQDITAAQVELMRIIALDLDGLIKGAQLLDRSQALAVTEERNSLARELHDSVTQILFSASMLAESIPLIWDKDQEIARMNIEKLSVLLREALAEMRSMLFELRSGDHQDQSLEELLTTLVDSAHARTQVVISLKVDDEPEPPEDVTQVFYRTAREALNNIIRHAEATQASISVLSEPNCAELRIKDNGRGFNPQEIDTGHMGIGIMSERVAEIGGNLQIQSTPGQGTMVVVTWSDNGVELIDNG